MEPRAALLCQTGSSMRNAALAVVVPLALGAQITIEAGGSVVVESGRGSSGESDRVQQLEARVAFLEKHLGFAPPPPPQPPQHHQPPDGRSPRVLDVQLPGGGGE